MSEVGFYKAHYGGGVPIGATPLDEYERDFLAPGKRYSLVTEMLALEPPQGGCIAEIGCGGAEALLIFSQRYRFDRVVGIDIAAATGNEIPPHIEFLDGNLNHEWPFADGEVDHLIAMMVIEHLFDPFHSFREIKRCLSEKGAAYVNLPLVTACRNRIRLLSGQLPETSVSYRKWFEQREWDGNHLHYFSLCSIKDLASECGLRVTDIRGVGQFHQLKTWFPGLLASEVTFRLQHAKALVPPSRE
jgi:SAM-dependent methyltransferase